MNSLQKTLFFLKHKGINHTLLKAWQYFLRRVFDFLYSNSSFSGIKHIFHTHNVSAQNNTTNSKEKIHLDMCSKSNISGLHSCIFGEKTDFSHTKNVIIAHWDMDNIIDPYVVYLCQAFMKMGRKVILASANPIADCPALTNCGQWCHAILYRTCPGYDFTSWKSAFDYFPSLYASKELILTNDSYFGPIPSFEHVHKRMEEENCDFWGMNYNLGVLNHLQSFYLVFKLQVLQSAAFKDFIDAIPLDNEKKKAVKCEMSMLSWLNTHKFNASVYCKLLKPIEFSHDFTKEAPKTMLDFGVPLFKRKNLFTSFGHKEYLKCKKNYPHSYPWQLIENYMQRKNISILMKKHR